jgi:hypothetical protein
MTGAVPTRSGRLVREPELTDDRRIDVATLRLIAVLLALTACGEQSGDVVDPAPTSELTITVRATKETPAETWTLTCEPPGGDHPRAETACRALQNASRDPFTPVPKSMLCAQVYGGPQTATITGMWLGTPVNASYRRTDGCQIARWDAIADVVGPGGR